MLDNHPITLFIARHRGLLFPCAAAALIFVILIPLPTWVLDFLLISDVLLATIVLMTVMYLRAPLEFSSFPSLLLAATLFRLVLNTATTRLILTNGQAGTDAAGQVIYTFGTFIAGNSLAVGVIIFLIITVVQFVVITKGATRIAEVAARFTLDGMPGKQMAIDADLNAGLIDETEARRRRRQITDEADFYGAMDGASKFVRGDAIAGLVITLVNILGGLYVGMVEGGMGVMNCLSVYTKLSIGDSLAAQIPAFLLSVAAAMLVTRSTGQTNMGEEVIGQLASRPIALLGAAAFLGVLMLTPMPKVPLLTMAGGCGTLAWFIRQHQVSQANRLAGEQRAKERTKPQQIEAHLAVDALELQIGFGLVKLVDRARGGDTLDRIAALRKQMAIDLGLIVPPIRIRDNSEIAPNRYLVLLRGQEIAGGELFPDQVLAIDSGLAGQRLSGMETREPAFGLKAWWIQPDDRERAESLNYTVVEPTGVLATHLTELIKRHAAELLTRADTQRLIDALKQRNATVVEEVVPNVLKVGEVQRILQNLLRERVPVRDLEAILEALGDWAPKSKDPEILTEYARNALARTICSQYKDAHGVIHCVTLDPASEDYLAANIQRVDSGSVLLLPPERQSEIATRTREVIEAAGPAAAGATIVLLCSPQVRVWLRRIIEAVLPQTPVLALNEIARGIDVQAHGVVSFGSQPADIQSTVHA
ncbi:MAG TPA: flagellar biosynthesis protein FlhA [Phycisphaerae bacterium]|mgnify:FL=1|nr:flagellar biosynthesis protein FlhA [Phycisphaerae bacterium]